MKNYLYYIFIFFCNSMLLNAQSPYYEDRDCDGFPSTVVFTSSSTSACKVYYGGYYDCDDNDSNIYPRLWHTDADGDGWGTPSTSTSPLCDPGPGFVLNGSDCDDTNPHLFMGTVWFLDANMNGILDENEHQVGGTGCTSPGPNYLLYESKDPNNNWTHSISYDVLGNTTSISRTYFDDLGKSNVTLSKDMMTDKTWRTETTYDSFGRPLKTSFPAVTPNTFEKIDVLSDPIAKSTYLDYYYGDTNSLNEFQATAEYPYTEAEYDPLNPGNVIRSYGGNKIETSPGVFEWKTGYSFTVPAAQEMHYVFGYNYFEGEIDGNKKEIATKFYKTITVDPHGIETAIFTDGEGKTLAIGKERATSTLQYPVYSTIGTQGYVDVYIPTRVSPTVISFLGDPSQYKIYNLKTGQIETSVSAGNAYRIEALVPPTIDPKIYVNMTTGAIEPEPTALGIKYVVRYYDYTLNYYDKIGRLTKTIQPNGFDITSVNANKVKPTTNHTFATTYTYNTLGQLIETSSPDEGTSRYAYRNDGQIRYSQSALQVLNNSISYTDYDTYGRLIESGVITGYSWNDAVANVNNDLPIASSNITYKEQTFSIYDFQGNTSSLNPPLSLSFFLNNADVNPANYEQHNLAGNVVTSWNNQSQSWYSYDLYGRLEWMVQNIEGLGAKTIDYEYNAKGQVKKIIYQRDTYPERFIHQYTYNFNGALESVATSTNDVTFEKQADYEYYIDGKLKRVVLAEGIQGTDYVYTLGGMLKSINHPSLDAAKDPGGDTNDVFGITLDYYSGDYKRTGKEHFYSSTSIQGVNQDNYDGNIKATRFATKDPNMDLDGGVINPKAYAYAYDHNKWLTNATFGNMLTNNNIQTVSSYKEGSLKYDANGNIRNLLRTDQNGTFVDAFKYIYKSGTNQLTRVDDTVASDVSANDIDTQPLNNYGYDAIGQLIENIQEKLKYFYNTQGLVTEVQKDGFPIVKFYYNERGNRVKKESFVPNSTTIQTTSHYVLDASGNTIANYTNSVLQELPVYGGSRLGVYNKNGNFTNYQITDHLGNVRAVIRKNGTSTTPLLQQYADYYPFGEQLPNRNSFGDYMYAYQGQELDSETGMEAFKLRLWDGRIGRWLSPDPYGQYHSPYLGMGNNPISSIDPDGGWETKFGAWWHGLWDGKDGTIFQSKDKGDWGINYVEQGEGTEQIGITTFGGRRYNNNSIDSSSSRSLNWSDFHSFTMTQQSGHKVAFDPTGFGGLFGDQVKIKTYGGVKTGDTKIFETNETFFNGEKEGINYQLNLGIGTINYRPKDFRLRLMVRIHQNISIGRSIGADGLGTHGQYHVADGVTVGIDHAARPSLGTALYVGAIALSDGAILTESIPIWARLIPASL